MDTTQSLRHALRDVLDAAEDASPVQAVEAVTAELGGALGAEAVSLLIADLSGRALVRLAHVPLGNGLHDDGRMRGERRDVEESATVLPFDGGPAERALRTQNVQVVCPGHAHAGRPPVGQWTVLAPVTERGESLGLLELLLPAEPGPDMVAEIAQAAHLLAFVIIANRRHTDLFEWGQRSARLTLPAEIQRRLLPAAFACEAGAFTLAAWLEPAASVAGDTFDYSLARDVLHLSMTDAMGHGVASALTASLCVGSLRSTRRHGLPLLEQAAAANAALVEHATSGNGAEDYVTGLLGRLDLGTGVLALVNAGHPAPYFARAGSVRNLELPADLPFGLFPGTTYRSTNLTLEPGDRLIILTDGMLERNAAHLDLRTVIAEAQSLHPRETVRCLADKVLDATGHALTDDATLLVLDWHGDHDRDRNSVAGADPVRATSSDPS